MTIQQAAKQTGLSVHTLRYYERIGLLDPVARRDNTHRLFREEDIRWIDFLLKLRGTGLPVRDMLRYAELRRQGDTSESVAARKALLVEHTRSVEKTLAELQGNLTILQKKICLYEEMQAAIVTPLTSSTQEETHHATNQHVINAQT
ncbi:MerR family transcriptional regulator [Undibacterium sp. RuRC25W]|uniref:MerR family transcriptional regulator n=1 Tax=Undibacterium sp. RuRC25W TaxID=3413047 RepID=UPI003BEFD6C8